MPQFDPAWMAEVTAGAWRPDLPAAGPTGFTQDTRRLQRGDCFVALRTGRRDGHDFLDTAREAGASAALVGRPVGDVNLPQLEVSDPLAALQQLGARHRRGFPGPVVGVTGSCGKTSTKELLARLLGEARTWRTPGNYNNFIGVPLTLLGLETRRHAFAVVEAGINRPGEMGDLGRWIEPDAGIVTLIGKAHLEQLKTLDGVAAEKVKLLEAVRPGGFRVFPASCLRYRPFAGLEGRVDVLAPFREERLRVPANYRIWRLAEARVPGGTELLLLPSEGRQLRFRLPRVSPGMRQNAALALVTALELGVSGELCRQRLESWEPVDNRGRWFVTGRSRIYLDAYNANPTSVLDALTAFREGMGDPDTGRLYVLGSMNELGATAPQEHRAVGEACAPTQADRVVCVGPYGRDLAAGAEDAAEPGARIEIFDTIAGLAETVADWSGPVFLKGSRSYGLEALLPGDARPFNPPPAT
ncbi:MAG: UDP-N-acetylmuramoyl-tripeptide--D-alanyl-D-alanine ligase [Opitutales bacterium]